MHVGVGVLGATGYIGAPYRNEIRQSGDAARIVALCARRQDRLREAASQDGAALVTDQWQDVVEHPDVDLVLVLTPDALHFEPIMACATRQKHVVCEKPVGIDARQASTMWQAIRQAGVFHFVPYWTRYHPLFLRARQFVDEGRLGVVQGVVYRWHNPRPRNMPYTWRDDAQLSAAGSIADVGSHAYDTIRFILREQAHSVVAHSDTVMPPKPDVGDVDLGEAIAWGEQHATDDADARRGGGTPDFCQLLLRFPSGIRGCMILSHASDYRKGFAPELELHGTDASLSIDRFSGELRFSDSPEPARVAETISEDIPKNRFGSVVFPALSQHLAGNASDDSDMQEGWPDMQDGWRVQVFVDAVVASARQRQWIELSRVEAASAGDAQFEQD